jgi:opacity protein-like surface antigen
VNATEVAPYVSVKASLESLRASNTKMIFNPSSSNYGTDEKDSVLGGKIAIGYSIETENTDNNIRLELEFGSSKSAKIDTTVLYHSPKSVMSSSFSVSTYYLNIYYDITSFEKFTPYLMFGFGRASVDVSSHSSSGMSDNYYIGGNFKNNVFTYSIGLGAVFNVYPDVFLDIGYRYTDLNAIKGVLSYKEGSKNSLIAIEGDLISHQFTIGARYNF